MFGESTAKVLIQTRTGEPYQPSRIYYEVANRKTVIGSFKKLRCMQWEPTLNAWRWLYDHEAKKLKFEHSWNQIPKEHRPVVLGDFYFHSDTEMVLDVRSFKRVTTAITFFDKHVNRRAAKVTKVRIVNKLFDANQNLPDEQLHPPFDYFFDRNDIHIPDPQAFETELTSAVTAVEGETERLQMFGAFLEERAKQPLPEVEEVPIYFYEDGIAPLEMALTFRNVEAIEHWRGNKTFSQHNLISQMLQVLQEKDLLLPEAELLEADLPEAELGEADLPTAVQPETILPEASPVVPEPLETTQDTPYGEPTP